MIKARRVTETYAIRGRDNTACKDKSDDLTLDAFACTTDEVCTNEESNIITISDTYETFS